MPDIKISESDDEREVVVPAGDYDDPNFRVDYKRLKAWVATQEAYEAAANEPAPLTPAQRRAVIELCQAPTPRNPEVGDHDWISLIHKFRNAHRHLEMNLVFTDAPAPGGWTSVVTVTSSLSAPLVFPSESTRGLIDVGERLVQPSFARKLQARQYAARCFAEYLMAAAMMPNDGVNVTFNMSHKQQISLPRVDTQQQQHDIPSGSSGGEAGSSVDKDPFAAWIKQAPKVRKGVATGPVDPFDDSIPATQRVTVMCTRLGMQAPRYDLIAMEGNGGSWWSGEPDFGNDSFHVPNSVGRVHKVYGKKAAKEKIAEEVLAYLIRVASERKAQEDALLGGGEPTS